MLVSDKNKLDHALTILVEADRIAIDTETTSTNDSTLRRLIGISTHCEIKGREPFSISLYFPFRHKNQMSLFENDKNLPLEWLRKLKFPFEREDCEFVFHNAKFDLLVLSHDGIEVPQFWDTMLMAHMLNENEYNFGLKQLAVKYLGPESNEEQKALKKLIKNMGSWEAVPPSVMEKYACKDAELTYKLFELFRPQLDKQNLTELWETEAEFARCLMEMEYRGIKINQQRAKELAYQSRCRMQEIQDSLGFDPLKPEQLARKLYSSQPEGLGLDPGPASSRVLHSPLVTSLGTTLSHIPQMDKAKLASHKHPVAEAVLEYRGHSKACSTWFEGFLEALCEDGRLRATYKQHRTKTTRLSCSNPNMQQLPRTSKEEQEQGVTKSLVKSILDVDEGYELWEFDYSQFELRLATCYGNDPVAVEIFTTGGDMHQTTADRLGITRFMGKTLNLAMQYGAGPRKLAVMLGISETEAQGIIDGYWSTYPGLAAAVTAAERAASSRGYIHLWTGRRRHFQWPSEYHKAFNSAVQGGAAEIMKRTMLQLRDFRLVAQVHDSVWIELPVGFDRSVIKKIMEWPTEKFTVPFVVDEKRLV